MKPKRLKRPPIRLPGQLAERWLPVVGWETRYEVSDAGSVRSLPTVRPNRLCGGVSRRKGKILRQISTPKGYLVVNLSMNKILKPRRIHQLVLEAFIGPRPDGMEACHTNGDNQDNRLENLRWDTHANNVRDRIASGQYASPSKMIGCAIERARDMRLNGCNYSQIARWLGVSGGHVSRVLEK